MTPGFAKSRAELPWLYYPRNDRVIINAHNFTPAATFSVNGKTPISVWCPTRDTAGLNTTTLSDLVGANTGTLTNFAMTGTSSNWVTDTGSGGAYAVDHDGVNDFVSLGTGTFFPTGSFAISWWEKIITAGSFNAVMAFKLDASSSLLVYRSTTTNYTNLTWRRSSSSAAAGLRATNASSPSSVLNQWRHFVLTGTSVASGTATDFSVFENGSALTIAAAGNFSASTFVNAFGRDGLGTFNRFRLDDARLFATTLDATDAAYLYNSGNGRGRVA